MILREWINLDLSATWGKLIDAANTVDSVVGAAAAISTEGSAPINVKPNPPPSLALPNQYAPGAYRYPDYKRQL